MKTYQELHNAARDTLIVRVDWAKANYVGSADEMEDSVWQDLEPAINDAVPQDADGLQILSILRQHPNALNTEVTLSRTSGTVREILVELLRNSLYSDLEAEAKTIIDAAVDSRHAQQAPTP